MLPFLLSTAVLAAQPVPTPARDVIAQVRTAAAASNYGTLRALMIDDIRWSFGGDATADQAIAEWRKDARYLKRLVGATGARCSYADGYVECGGKPTGSFRAGFAKVAAQWKMVYFIEAD